MRMFERVGGAVLRFCTDVGALAGLMASTLAWAVRPPWDGGEVVRQMWRLGVQSVPVVFVTATFTGAVMTLQTYQGFQRFGATSFVGTLVALSVMRELAPVLTALMVTGRSGSAIAAEIGTMQVTEQVEALVAMATEPIQYLFVPRVLAGVTMMPVLVMVADALAILGGRVVAVNLLGANPDDYDQSTWRVLELNDLTSGLIKAAVFGFLFTLVACARGYQTTGGAEGVGRTTTNAVVTGSVCVIVSDFFLSRMMF